jgi:hypothetical protein
MAGGQPFVIRNPNVKVAGTDLSTHIRDVAVAMTAADVDTTASGSGGHERILGIRDDSFTLTAYSDFSASQIDQTIWPLFQGGSLFVVEVWANPGGTLNSPVTALNPKYWGTCILTEYHPIEGGIGDAAMTPLSLPVNGVINRSTA